MVEEYAARAPQINQRYLTVSDHGMMGAIPRQTKACDDNGIKPIYAVELYLNPHQTERKNWEDKKKEFDTKEKAKKLRKSYHLLAIAYTNQGYKNLVKLASWGWTEGFYYKPRVNREMVYKYREGIMFTSCCYLSEIGQAFDQYGEEKAFEMVELYSKMFGENFRLELMLLDFKKQKPYDAFILKAHDRYGIPLIITNDAHYCNKEDSHYQRLMLMVNQKSTIAEVERRVAAGEAEDLFELQDQNLWMKSEDELNAKWESDYSEIIDYELFKQAKANTVKICEMVDVKLDRSLKLPDIPDADEQLKEAVRIGFLNRGLPKSKKYQTRILEELNLIFRKGFSSYFLIQKAMTDEARRISPELLGWGDGTEAVGPGRGCLAGDSKIITKNGVFALEDVQEGDNVLNRDGSFRPVEKKFVYEIDEPLYRLKTLYGVLKLTSDHMVWVEKSERPKGKFNWFRADELKVGDWTLLPNNKKISFGDDDLVTNNNGIMQRIRSIELVEGIKKVYDLKIANGGEENFCTTSGLVHNSAVGALVCYCLGITDVDPVKHDLLFSRFLSEARGGRSIKLRFKNIDPLVNYEKD